MHHFPAHARPARLQAGLQDGEFKGMDYDEAFQQLKVCRTMSEAGRRLILLRT
jgi:hypothetical protein